MSASICLTSSLYRTFSLLATSSDRFPIPVRWAVKSYLTAWCIQNLSNRATLNAATLVHSVTSERKLDCVQNFHFQYQKSFREPKTRWHEFVLRNLRSTQLHLSYFAYAGYTSYFTDQIGPTNWQLLYRWITISSTTNLPASVTSAVSTHSNSVRYL